MYQLSTEAIDRRKFWVTEIKSISGNFVNDTSRIEAALRTEIAAHGATALRDHLHMCGAIPELYGHDSSEEKLYSKYTDILLTYAFRHIGLSSVVYTERADAADVEATCDEYSLVADAKAFRLSRTAKNQKDFKVQAMDGWRQAHTFSVVVCPIYQVPKNASQIYLQAITRNVCVFTYSHLALLVSLAEHSPASSRKCFHDILRCVSALNPTKDAQAYWLNINRVMLQSHATIGALWRDEKLASMAAMAAAKDEALLALSKEKIRILAMSRDEAIQELVKKNNIEGRVRAIAGVQDNALLDLI